MAEILGIDSIPVNVLVRHHEWQPTRDEIRGADGSLEPHPERRTHLDHPDLRHLVAKR